MKKPAAFGNFTPRIDPPAGMINCMSVDVEDYFQVTGFEDRVSRKNWDRYECRVEASTNQLLSIFDSASVVGTLFILGWIAERFPKLVRRIANAGHEIASHGYWHQLVYDLNAEQFERDILLSRAAIYNACGIEVTAYRAPSFSIVPRSRWALGVLASNGFKTDSSVFPIKGHHRYGDPTSPRHIHSIETKNGTIVEFPPTAASLVRLPVPIGGGYFRLLPLRMTGHAIAQVNKEVGPAMFYIHPWEIDPGQPRIEGVSRGSRFRHYVGLKSTEAKLRRLLSTFQFGTLSDVMNSNRPDNSNPDQLDPSNNSTQELVKA